LDAAAAAFFVRCTVIRLRIARKFTVWCASFPEASAALRITALIDAKARQKGTVKNETAEAIAISLDWRNCARTG